MMPSLRLLLTALLLPFAVQAGDEPTLSDAGSLGGIRLANSEDPGFRKVYIVQLQQPSAAEFYSAAAAPSARTGGTRTRFDKTSPVIQEYAARLLAEQDRMLAVAGPGVDLVYRYQYGLNGFAARMHPSQAHKLQNHPDVLQVWEDEIRPLPTDDSLTFLGLFNEDNGLRNIPGLDGDGIIVGVIDSGIAPNHPALADTREADRPALCEGDWAENTFLGRWLCHRFEKREDVLLFDPPEGWNGECQAGEQFEAGDCNNKLIGARYFVSGAEATGPIDDGEIMSARDVDGHGTHTATTAAGNRVRATIFGAPFGRIEGVAPGARVAVYKACWLRPGDSRASCNSSDLANAIDAAVADGVDIINYSVGSSLDRITAPDDVALMAASKAGVFTVVAAGNDGPAFDTIGSPAGGPWIITAAASTRTGESSNEALEIESPPAIAGLYVAKEANFTPALLDVGPIDGDLVLVDDGDDVLESGAAGTTSDACEPLINGSEVSGKIALIQRGGCLFQDKIAHADDAGAIAAVVYNIAGDAIVMNGDEGAGDIPAVMIGQADGNLVLAELDSGLVVRVRLDKSLFLTENDTGNQMASFSSRGQGPVLNVLKPDVTAPGVNILAGFTPDAVNATPGEKFAFLSGTSMSTPHVAGVAALLRQANPDWSPSAVKSALMTTARQDITLDDGVTAANPFNFGAGHIVPNDAIDPGLVYDVSDDEYDAFACGIASPAVAGERCNELGAAGFSFAAEDLNQPSIAVAQLASQQTIRRRVTSVSDESETYTAEVVAPSGVTVDVIPASFSIAPGESVEFDVTLTSESGPLDLWRFGSITWRNSDHAVYSTLAIRPASITAPGQVDGAFASGSGSFPVQFGYTGSYSAGVHGLSLPLVLDGFVDRDPNKTFTFRNGNGVTIHLIDVVPNQLYARFSLFDFLTDGDDDLDLYVYFCADQVNCVKLGESGEPTSQEEFNIFNPEAGRYAILVHGFETDQVAGGPGAVYKLLAWSFGINDDRGNMTVTAPAMATAGTTESITIDWSGLQSDTIYLGGISHNTPDGLRGLTVVRITVPQDPP